MKLLDVRRDPQVAIHSPKLEPPKNPSEWRVRPRSLARSSRSTPRPTRRSLGGYLRMDITEVVLT
jgi:hypothetical protein